MKLSIFADYGSNIKGKITSCWVMACCKMFITKWCSSLSFSKKELVGTKGQVKINPWSVVLKISENWFWPWVLILNKIHEPTWTTGCSLTLSGNPPVLWKFSKTQDRSLLFRIFLWESGTRRFSDFENFQESRTKTYKQNQRTAQH